LLAEIKINLKPLKITAFLFIYGLTHLLVDASCVLLLLGGIDAGGDLLTYLVLYNVLAFGLQLPFGWLVDKLQKPAQTAILGCIVLSAGLFLYKHPFMSITLAGIGNALFHVGGGTISLNLKPGKAALPGVFVAPGGIGLFVGGLVAKLYGFRYEIAIVLLLTMVVLMTITKVHFAVYKREKANVENYLIVAIVLFLLTICIRSIVGLSINFPWKSNSSLLLMLTLAIALGKGLGGFLADKFGWVKITVGGLALSALLLFFGAQLPATGIIGLFLFNLSMPVTLTAIANVLPNRLGFSFGLTTFAILLGALPTFTPVKWFFEEPNVFIPMIVISTLALFVGLRLYSKNSTTN
jgi:FSR family fosmidomycin resistance protein-like MFS transporter